MRLRTLCNLLAVGLLMPSSILSAVAAVPFSARTVPPNVVHIVLDEWGYFEMSALGHPDLKTPNIDRLAATGTRFTQCLAGGPVCAPTRCSLMTGKHAGHMTVRGNSGKAAIRADEETIASMFKRAGYRTGGFGKWGIGARGTSGVPERHGFDVFFGYYSQVHAHTYYPRYLVRNSEEVPQGTNTGSAYPPGGNGTFSQYSIFKEASAFIARNQQAPFYLYLPWTPPHGLWGFPTNDPAWALFKDKPWTGGQVTTNDGKVYAALLSLADRQIGDLLAQLKRLELITNTIVMLSGDNGGVPYFEDRNHADGLFAPNVNPLNRNEHFRGKKGTLYEGGLRIPFIVSWPGKIPAGRVCDHLCYFPDVMPTLAELTGVPCPSGTDGTSFASVLLGDSKPKQSHSWLYWEYEGAVAVRMGPWKALRPGTNAAWELYDLTSDISESRNLASLHPELVARAAGFAAQAHEPCVEGECFDPALAAKDDRYAPAR